MEDRIRWRALPNPTGWVLLDASYVARAAECRLNRIIYFHCVQHPKYPPDLRPFCYALFFVCPFVQEPYLPAAILVLLTPLLLAPMPPHQWFWIATESVDSENRSANRISSLRFVEVLQYALAFTVVT